MAHKLVLEFLERGKQLHTDKDTDYSGGESLSNFKRSEHIGVPAWKGAFIRLQDKFARCESLIKNDEQPAIQEESLDDTLLDLMVYSAIVLALREEQAEKITMDFLDHYVAISEQEQKGQEGQEQIREEQIDTIEKELVKEENSTPLEEQESKNYVNRMDKYFARMKEGTTHDNTDTKL